MLKAVIADDDAVFTEYIQKCVDWDALGTEVDAVASNGREAMELVAGLQPDIVVMDIEMPGASGLECVERIRAVRQDCEILLVTGHDEFQYAQLGARYGVAEILLKPTTKHSLEAALKNAVDGHWLKRMADCAMRAATGRATPCEALDLIDEDDREDGAPALCMGIADAVRESDPSRIQDAVSRYLFSVTDPRVPNDRLFWLSVLPALICAALTTEEGASGPPAPFDDMTAILERIQAVCFGAGAQQTLCELCSAASDILRRRPRRGRSPAADEALLLIRQNYPDPKFSVASLAEMMHFHEGYLRRVFKSAFGKSPNTVLKETRMNEAKRLFSAGDMQIQQISQLVGFEDASYFSKCFKQYFGCAPSEYKRPGKP